MSAVITVCGENFCTFVSDGRCVVFRNNEIVNIRGDEFEKIFKLNDKLLYAYTGIFNDDKDILAPFDEYPDKSVLTMNMAIKCIERYIRNGKGKFNQINFLLGGKNNKGQYQLNTFKHIENDENIETDIMIPNSNEFAIKASVPNIQENILTELLNKHLYSTSPWGTHEVLLQHMIDFIKDIEKIDISVGGKIKVCNVM